MSSCTNRFCLLAALVASLSAVADQDVQSLVDARELRTVCGTGADEPAGYVPPLVANGELAMPVDWTFGSRPKPVSQYSQGIFLEGRRVSHPNRELLPQGRWEKKLVIDGRLAGVPERWEQRLDERTGIVTCRQEYSAVVFVGETFIPFGENTIAIRMSVTAKMATAVVLGVNYLPPKHPRIVGAWQPATDVRRGWACRSYGYRVLDGVTAVHGRERTFDLKQGETREATFFVTFSDSMRVHPGAPRDYAALKTSHEAAWRTYRSESSVSLPEPALQRMWDMANYHLRINATPWSSPVGILNSHWQGLYFGFDEMYMHQGLLSSGHFAVSRRAPEYRFATLGPALARNRYGGNGKFVKYGARYCWESLEDGQSEGTVPGEWMDHIFHMATIAKCAWQQWLYERDRGWFEKKGYPVLLECARFYLNNWVYEDSNGEAYIGKCCDLERLGPSRERPFMTTCGVIYTFRSAAEACELLGRNREETEAFRRMADRLERGLPQKGGRYITCLNEPQESMATLAGFFPFPIFPPDHAPQREAVRHFIAEGRASGNMYPTGKRICPWYAGTMSAASSWMGDRAESVRWLREAASAAGLFGEFFEINEPDVVHHPWFGTAAGNCLYAINQMLLCDHPDAIHLADAVPVDWRDYSFTLPSLAGVSVTMSVKGGALTRLAVTPRPGVAGSVRLSIRTDLWSGSNVALPPDVMCRVEGDHVLLVWPL